MLAAAFCLECKLLESARSSVEISSMLQLLGFWLYVHSKPPSLLDGGFCPRLLFSDRSLSQQTIEAASVLRLFASFDRK